MGDGDTTGIQLHDFQTSVLFIVQHWVKTNVFETTDLVDENMGFDTSTFFRDTTVA